LKQVDGAGAAETLFQTNQSVTVDSWSPDGRLILYDEEDASGKSGIWQLPLQSDRKPVAVLRSDFLVRSARLSPDQRWMAYVSNETGRDEIYAQRFPGPSGKSMISAVGGTEPCWRGDARELFFLSASRVLMSVQTDDSSQVLRAGVPRPLFPTRRAQWYALSDDGKHFLVTMTPDDTDPPSINVLLNWTQDLRR
jgi:Tol biopolymer transport system component